MSLQTAEVRRLFGEFTYTPGKKWGSILPDPKWVKANIVTVVNKWGLLTPGRKLASIRCHRLIAAKITAVFDDLAGQGLLGLIGTYDGCYVPRHTNWDPHKRLSRHSWGIAVDVNAGRFPYGVKGRQPEKVISAFTAHGFEYGGNWRTPDPMHWECINL